jgi:hypothetical protein
LLRSAEYAADLPSLLFVSGPHHSVKDLEVTECEDRTTAGTRPLATSKEAVIRAVHTDAGSPEPTHGENPVA